MRWAKAILLLSVVGPSGYGAGEGDFWVTVLDHPAFDFAERGERFYAATSEGLFVTMDSGESWNLLGPAVETRSVTANALNTLYVLRSSGVFRSNDLGATWEQLPAPPISFPGSLLLSLDSATVFLSSPGLYRSSDFGETWQATCVEGEVRSVTGNHTALYAGTWLGGIYRSHDEGVNCDTLYEYPGIAIAAIALGGNEDIYAVENGENILGEWHLVLRSADYGATWDWVYSTPLTLLSLAVDDDKVYLGSVGGVFHSTDAGKSWDSLNSGLSDDVITALSLDRNGYLFSGNQNSVQRSVVVVDVAAGEDYVSSFVLRQNYPNPFNGISNFEFWISNLSDVTLTVFDLLGREVATVFNERLPAGTYTRQWDASGLPSGVYLYRLRTGSYVETKKLMLLR